MSDPKTKSRNPEWPGTVKTGEELDDALDEGLKSGRSPRTMKQIIEDELSRIKHD